MSGCLSEEVWHAFNEGDGDWDEICKTQPELTVLRNEAIKWCFAAANQGLADGQYKLWLSLWSGDSDSDAVPIFDQRPEEAVEWLRKAVAQGHQKAIDALLGDLEWEEYSLKNDFWEYPRAFEAVHLVADNGNAKAAFLLASLYSLADARMRDHNKAEEWLQRAATLGHVEAAHLILEGFRRVPGKGPEDFDEEDGEEPLDKIEQGTLPRASRAAAISGKGLKVRYACIRCSI